MPRSLSFRLSKTEDTRLAFPIHIQTSKSSLISRHVKQPLRTNVLLLLQKIQQELHVPCIFTGSGFQLFIPGHHKAAKTSCSMRDRETRRIKQPTGQAPHPPWPRPIMPKGGKQGSPGLAAWFKQEPRSSRKAMVMCRSQWNQECRSGPDDGYQKEIQLRDYQKVHNDKAGSRSSHPTGWGSDQLGPWLGTGRPPWQSSNISQISNVSKIKLKWSP